MSTRLKLGWTAVVVLVVLMTGAFWNSAWSTWAPTGKEDPATKRWFEQAKLTPEACARLMIASCHCCAKADRFKTEFRTEREQSPGVNRWKDVWYYKVGDVWIKVPEDIIHWEDDAAMPVQLKIEGVLFIYNGNPTCFWPPRQNGG